MLTIIFFKTFNTVLMYCTNFGLYCRSIWGYIYLCQMISTEGTGCEIERGNRMSQMNSFNFYSALAKSMGTISPSDRIAFSL